MKHPRSYQRRSASANRSDYEQLFIRRVHELIKLGYDRLCASAYATQEETVITGDLVEAIESILEDANEDWMRFYRVYDDPPVNESIKATRRKENGAGELISSSIRPRFRRTHASILKRNVWGRETQFRDILVPMGLVVFLSGSYAGAEQRGGMLGYVQSDDEQTWAAKIDKAFSILSKFIRSANEVKPLSIIPNQCSAPSHLRFRASSYYGRKTAANLS